MGFRDEDKILIKTYMIHPGIPVGFVLRVQLVN